MDVLGIASVVAAPRYPPMEMSCVVALSFYAVN